MDTPTFTKDISSNLILVPLRAVVIVGVVVVEALSAFFIQ